MSTYSSFKLEVENYIAHLSFNRPEKANSLTKESWAEMKDAFESFSLREDVRVVVLSGEGKHFCAGIDLGYLMEVGQLTQTNCEGRKREKLFHHILYLQDTVSAIARCTKPVLAAIHRGCIGGALDIISACDMRYASEDAYIVLKEIDMGMVADLGTLQRLPKLIPDGVAREMAFTGRKMPAQEALQRGLVNSVSADKAAMMDEVMGIAAQIAAKSPLSVRGTKEMMNYSRDHSVEEGLRYMASWNAAMLMSNDIQTAMQAQMSKQNPVFQD
ncbi:MAG: crotonase/enoyl-CoA hydratase family protein [Bacteroidota bacterium]